MQFLIPNSVRWITSTLLPKNEAFYPSLSRRIEHSDQHFIDNFYIQLSEVDEKVFLEKIFPLYEKEIVIRENYIFEPAELKNKYLGRIRDGRKYFLYGFYQKDTENLVGGFLYSIPHEIISVAMRFFDRSINKNTKTQATLDFWGEWKFYDFVKNEGHNAYSLGIDHYPNIDRAGLPLYKLKVGSLPCVNIKSESITIHPDLKKITDHLIFFTDEDKSGHYRKLNCLYKNYIQGGVLDELEKVTMWAGLEFYKEEIKL